MCIDSASSCVSTERIAGGVVGGTDSYKGYHSGHYSLKLVSDLGCHLVQF